MKRALKPWSCGLVMILIIMMIPACGEKNAYRLTVEDLNGVIIEPFRKTYQPGEKVTVKAKASAGMGLLAAALDGEALEHDPPVRTSGDPYVYWDFYFMMPAHDAVLSFEFYDE